MPPDLLPGDVLSGTVAAIKPFGVFVDLDDGPRHPTFPGVGFITYPELPWRFGSAEEIVQVGQRVSCEFLQFDTSNGEARLSLRALQPDPVRAFLDDVVVGQVLRGTIIKVVPFGVFVRVADGVEGLVPLQELAVPAEELLVGAEILVAVARVSQEQRKLVLSQRRACFKISCFCGVSGVVNVACGGVSAAGRCW